MDLAVIRLWRRAFIGLESSVERIGARTTVLPAFNDSGDLPPGVHAATWQEVEQQFGHGSPARRRAMATLRHIHELAARAGALRKLYVLGSFVSAASEPRDVDVLLVMAADFRIEHCPRESLTLFSHADAEARYGASVFWLREAMLAEAQMRDLLLTWQTKRDGAVRGILEVA